MVKRKRELMVDSLRFCKSNKANLGRMFGPAALAGGPKKFMLGGMRGGTVAVFNSAKTVVGDVVSTGDGRSVSLPTKLCLIGVKRGAAGMVIGWGSRCSCLWSHVLASWGLWVEANCVCSTSGRGFMGSWSSW